MKYLRKPHPWVILAILVILGILQYAEQIGLPGTLPPSEHFGLTRHTLDRVLFLIPIVYSSLVLGLSWGLATCAISLAIMLPRVFLLSPAPQDALLETIAVVLAGEAIVLGFRTAAKKLQQERRTRAELEEAHKRLQHYFQLASKEEKRFISLNKISTALAESLELPKVLQKTLDMIMELMELEVALIFSVDEEKNELVLLAYEGVTDSFAREVNRTKVGEGFNGRVAKIGEPLIVKDIAVDPATDSKAVKEMKMVSEMIVPMSFQERVVGTIWIAQRRPRDFLPEDVNLLTAIGSQIAIAIVNARLYETSLQLRKQMSVAESNFRELFHNASDAMWVHDLEGNIVAANKAAEKLTGYSTKELLRMNVRGFIAEESIGLAGQVRRRLFEKQPVEQPYDLQIIKSDGTKSGIKVTSTLVTSNGKITGFQHAARSA